MHVASDTNCSLVGAVLRIVVNNHVATNSSLLNSFFTSTSSIMLWITSSVTDEYLSIVRFVIRFICNEFNSDYSIYDNSSCNFDSLSHRTFHLAVIKYNAYFFIFVISFLSIPIATILIDALYQFYHVKDFYSYLFYYSSIDNFVYI